MFDEVSPRYDLINDVLTAGNDRLWRIATTRAVAPREGMRILDLAAGTGTSSAALAAHGAHVVAADFSEGMLAEGRRRHAGEERIEFVHADATALPFEDDSFDAATISYGLRNVSDPRRALAEMFRVVKPGGRVVIAEFSTPASRIVRAPYAFYGRHVLPRIAGAINRDAAQAYRYLTESIEAWPDQEELAAWLREAGFDRVAYRNLTFGIVALHRGFVPREAAAKAKPAPERPAATPNSAPATPKAAPAEPKAAPARPKAAAKPAATPKVVPAKTASAKAKPAPPTPKTASAKAKPAPATPKADPAKPKAAAKPAAKPKAARAKPANAKAKPAGAGPRSAPETPSGGAPATGDAQ